MKKTEQQIKIEISALKQELTLLEHKRKSSKGIMNEGEWCLLTCEDEDGHKEYVVFYASVDGIPVCMNGYFDWDTVYIYDLLAHEPHYEKWKAKKVTKEVALQYL